MVPGAKESRIEFERERKMRRFRSFFLFQETTQGGLPQGDQHRIPYEGAYRALCLLCPMLSRKMIQHYLELAAAGGHGALVDMVQHDDYGRLIWSARLEYRIEKE